MEVDGCGSPRRMCCSVVAGAGAAGHGRCSRQGGRSAGRGAAWRDRRRAPPGERAVPRGRHRDRWPVPDERDDARRVRSVGRAGGLQEVRAPRHAASRSARTAQVEVKLEVGGVAETVTVTGESPLVDTTSNEIGGRISAQEFVDTPSFNRNFAGYLGMLPGVVASISATTFGADSISVAGQNVRNVNYTMDGSNNNDTFNGGNGGAQARVPVEAVQEFQLLTSQFDAEFGLASGGVVNSVSKSGTNQYHGSAFFFHQDQNLAAVDYFAKKAGLEESDSKQQQWGGTLGGPIVRDKAHYFFSLERIALDSAVTTNIPSRPDLARTDFEISRVWNTFLRADHQLNAGEHLRHPLAARNLAAAAADPGGEPHAVPARSRDRRRLDRRRQPQLGDRLDAGSTRSASRRSVRGRVLRQSDLQHQRSRPEEPAAAAELPELPGSAERARQPPARRRLRRRRRVRLVRAGQGRRSRSQVRRELPVFVAAESGLRQPERHVHHQQRPAVRPEQPADLSRAAAKSACRTPRTST